MYDEPGTIFDEVYESFPPGYKEALNINKKSRGVYIITSKTSSKFYIGGSTRVYSRIIDHKRLLRGNRHHNIHLNSAWNLYGEQDFDWMMLEDCGEASLEDIYKREQYYLDTLRPFDREIGYNLNDVASGGSKKGHKKSEEMRCKLSKSKMGVKPSKEARHKMRLAKLGRHLSPEHKKKLSILNKGKIISPEQRLKISIANRGKKHVLLPPERYGINHCFVSPDGAMITIHNLKNFCKENNLSYGCMMHLKHGRCRVKCHKGYKRIPILN
jgi:group I intron endonuclease